MTLQLADERGGHNSPLTRPPQTVHSVALAVALPATFSCTRLHSRPVLSLATPARRPMAVTASDSFQRATVRADPKPDCRVALECANGSITDAHSSGVDWRVRMYLLEAQAQEATVLQDVAAHQGEHSRSRAPH